MRITVNGHVFQDPASLDVLFELNEPGEFLGGIHVTIKGGFLSIKGKKDGLRVDVDRDYGLVICAGLDEPGGYGICVQGAGTGSPMVILGREVTVDDPIVTEAKHAQ
jgi:hypothetical protein